MIRRALLLALAPLVLAATPAAAQRSLLDGIAIDYVKLTLEIGEREPGYVDAYFGPPEMATAAKANPRDVKALSAAAAALTAKLTAIEPSILHPTEQRRRAYLLGQLKAAETRLAMLQGKKFKFVDEAEALFGVRPVLKPLAEYDAALAQLDKMLPGPGPLAARVAAEAGGFVIPTDKADAVMRAAIAECRARTFKHVTLPAKERFDLEFVKNQPWGGYNWFKGDTHSLIQINTDLPVTISRAIDLGCHEGYPGHHTYMSRLEEKLVNGRGWIEFSVYPLYSPQSFIAEGSANAGIKLAFPGDEQAEFEAKTLYPLAGIAPSKAVKHDAVLKALEELKGASVTIQQMYLDGEIDRAKAVELLGKYALSSPEGAAKSLDFADRYRSYVINYGLGAEMITQALEAGGADEKTRWERMVLILSEPTVPADLAR
ncbi:hypothetical protein [Sphingomonas soli]|uniref:hypothetical protein n=1 Tax=Sphingomonas soli TaxID=266127 RepID=UPI000A4CB140|nr:hypothetical protein [Sphingomonas soli]